MWLQHSVGRYGGRIGAHKSVLYYLARAPILWLPWVPAVGIGIYQAFRRGRLAPQHRNFLLAWGLGGLVFLTISPTKYTHYALLITPPFLVFGGVGLDFVLFEVPRRLATSAKVIFWPHVLLAPGLAAAGSVAAWMLPGCRVWLAVLGWGAAVLFAIVCVLYYRRRRVACLVVCAAGVLVGHVLALGKVIVPLANEHNFPALTGRYIAAHAPAGRGAAIYFRLHSAAVYYAGRPLTIIRTPEELAVWRRANPGGLLLVNWREQRRALERLGPWDEIDPRPRPPAGLLPSRYKLLKVPQAEPRTAGDDGFDRLPRHNATLAAKRPGMLRDVRKVMKPMGRQ